MRVKVPKEMLLETLQKNLAQHKQDFDEAWDSYLSQTEERVRLLADEIKDTPKGRIIELRIGLPVPVSHEADYVIVIGLLNIANQNDVELDDGDYRRYVLDEWDWKHQFSSTNTFYKGEI